MLWKSESEIRKIVRDEIRRVLNNEAEYRVKRSYDEEGRLIETDYTYFADEGHIVHLMTKHKETKTDFYVCHSRTHKNYEEARSSGADIESLDRKYNEENVFKRNGPLPAGFQAMPNGLIIPEERTR